MNKINKFAFTFAWEMTNQCTCPEFDPCPVHSTLLALGFGCIKNQ